MWFKGHIKVILNDLLMTVVVIYLRYAIPVKFMDKGGFVLVCLLYSLIQQIYGFSILKFLFPNSIIATLARWRGLKSAAHFSIILLGEFFLTQILKVLALHKRTNGKADSFASCKLVYARLMYIPSV